MMNVGEVMGLCMFRLLLIFWVNVVLFELSGLVSMMRLLVRSRLVSWCLSVCMVSRVVMVVSACTVVMIGFGYGLVMVWLGFG